MQYIINLGKQLVNSLKYIEKRTNMKVKTSFLNLFVFDDIYTLDSIPEVLIFLAGAPKGLYDAKTDDALVNIFWTQNYKNYSVTA